MKINPPVHQEYLQDVRIQHAEEYMVEHQVDPEHQEEVQETDFTQPTLLFYGDKWFNI